MFKKPKTGIKQHEGHDSYRGRRAIAAFIAPLGLLGLAACGELPANPPATSANQTPGDKTPEVSASPTDSADLDAFRDDLTGKTIDQIYPMSEKFTPNYIDAHPEEISDIFPVTAEEAATPKGAIHAWFERQNSMSNFGSGETGMNEGSDGSDSILATTKAYYLQAWRALTGHGNKSMPTPTILGNQEAAARAFQATAVARTMDHPAFMPVVAHIPDLENMKVTEAGDGTYTVVVDVRVVFKADQENIDKLGVDIKFAETDEVGKVTFSNCSTKSGNFNCESVG